MQNLKTRFMLLVFMLLLNTSNFNTGAGIKLQAQLLTKLDKNWPGLATNNNVNPRCENKSESIISAKALEQVDKAITMD